MRSAISLMKKELEKLQDLQTKQQNDRSYREETMEQDNVCIYNCRMNHSLPTIYLYLLVLQKNLRHAISQLKQQMQTQSQRLANSDLNSKTTNDELSSSKLSPNGSNINNNYSPKYARRATISNDYPPNHSYNHTANNINSSHDNSSNMYEILALRKQIQEISASANKTKAELLTYMAEVLIYLILSYRAIPSKRSDSFLIALFS